MKFHLTSSTLQNSKFYLLNGWHSGKESTCQCRRQDSEDESQETWVWSLGWEDPLGKGMAWEIPWAEKPSGLQSMGSQRVRHDWVHVYAHTHVHTHTHTHRFTRQVCLVACICPFHLLFTLSHLLCALGRRSWLIGSSSKGPCLCGSA